VKHAGAMTSSDIAGALRKQIETERFALNDRLPPERVLAERFGVARGTVREALKQLELGGLVERRAGSGTYVTWSDRGETRPIVEITRPLELVDARLAMEPHMCRLAVLHATEVELAHLDTFLDSMQACETDPERFADIDEGFHRALAACTQNPLIEWIMDRMTEIKTHAQWARMRTLTLTPEMIRTYNAQHRAIVDAIRNRESETAASAMRAHLTSARRSLVEAAG